MLYPIHAVPIGEAIPRRWGALYVLCAGVLLIVLDSTIVNVALPSMRDQLGFDGYSLSWVVNAYMLTYGGFLLLGGRLGDLFGRRRAFLWGIALFTVASLACGFAVTAEYLIAARAVQGLGGAVVASVALSLIMDFFPDGAERAKALGIYGFVCAAGGSVGLLCGGLLTSALGWQWVFRVNLPIGATVCLGAFVLLPPDSTRDVGRRVDVWGAITVTVSFMLATYTVVATPAWSSARTWALLTAAVVVFIVFVFIERRVREPLVPLGIFRIRTFRVASVVRALWAAALAVWFFLSALYVQRVLGHDPMQIALAFLPANALMALFSLGLSARMVTRFGSRIPLVVGLLLGVAGLLLLSRAPVDGSVMWDVVPAMILLGAGTGMSLGPMLLAALSDVPSQETGVASGIVNTASLLGGSLGLAVLASLAAKHTVGLLDSGVAGATALVAGYRVSFLAAAACALAAAVVSAVFLRNRTR